MTTPVDALKIEGMSMEEFLTRSHPRPIKLIDGEIIEMSPTILMHSLVLDNAKEIFSTHAKDNHPGRVFSETTYVLPTANRRKWVKGSRVPDMMFYSRSRFSQYIKTNPDWKPYPLALIPELVVEVLSPNDSYTEVMRDVTAYLQDGVRVILVLDPAKKTLVLHSPDSAKPVILKETDTLNLDAVMRDFRIPVRAFFAIPEEDEDEGSEA